MTNRDRALAVESSLALQKSIAPLAAFDFVENERISVLVAGRVQNLADVVQDSGSEAVEVGIEIEQRPVLEVLECLDDEWRKAQALDDLAFFLRRLIKVETQNLSHVTDTDTLREEIFGNEPGLVHLAGKITHSLAGEDLARFLRADHGQGLG